MAKRDDLFRDLPRGLPADDKAPSLAAASNQAQVDIEAEKCELVRALHDDLGGLLVGAVMGLGWISGHTDLVVGVVLSKLDRALELLRAAIDLKRELIEALRPPLLDNVGLYSTWRWHMKARCDAAAVPFTAHLPPPEQSLPADVRI